MTLSNSSPAFQRMVHQLVAASQVEEPVLLTGEVGTGKRQSAASIHKASLRRSGRFVTLNCLGLSEARFESEMFGVISPNFEVSRKGALSLAEGGTLYLHEVTELSSRAQALLVRFLESGVYCPLNGADMVRANVRLVCSSSLPVENMVEAGVFRNDLYHLISTITIHTPSLNDRIEDIPMLVASILREMGAADRVVTNASIKPLLEHSFSGNLVELRNIVFRVLHNFSDKELSEEHFRFALRADPGFETAFGEAMNRSVLGSEYFLSDPMSAALGRVDRPKGGGGAAGPEGRLHSDSPVAARGIPASQNVPVRGRGQPEAAFPAVVGESLERFADVNRPVRLADMMDGEVLATNTIPQVAETAVRHSASRTLSAPPLPPVPGAAGLKSLKEQERDYFRQLLEYCDGDKKRAAEIAGVNLRTLYRRLEGLD